MKIRANMDDEYLKSLEIWENGNWLELPSSYEDGDRIFLIEENIPQINTILGLKIQKIIDFYEKHKYQFSEKEMII